VKLASVQKLSTAEEWHQDQSYLPETVDYRNKDQNPEKLPCVPLLVKMVSVAQKQSMVEERRQDKSYLI
jgi:hypothetical protein